MKASTLVLLVGTVTTGAVLIAQWRLLWARPEHFRMERLRGAVALVILVVSFSVMHWYLTQAEREPERCCLQTFSLPEEPPPPGSGPPPPLPPAPPRPPES
jgi:hypothetical protein